MMRRASADLSDPDRNLVESMGESAQTPDLTPFDAAQADHNEARIFTPPPRIAARFYKPSATRRKSSAASSRRNSISSAQSHPSHPSHASRGSFHGRAQSNYVEQHLRRASIIEDRKARLADRAAHAEKVRLRAALAKAAPRSSNNSEERALAAEKAREKNLAEIVASCAEEVRRAKGIAESMKEKREAEEKRRRREMEERLAEAEKRREEILNRGAAKRGRSLSTPRKTLSPTPEVKETVISEDVATLRIQRRWHIYRRWKALKDFADLGLSIDGVRDTSFEQVTELLAQERVLVGTAQILRVCGLKEGESGSVNEMTAVRTFLSAFLILGHPTPVLSSKGGTGQQEQVGIVSGSPMMRRDDLANPQLQDLVSKAKDLLISFETVLSRLTPTNNYTPPPTLLGPLSESYATFFNAFIAWKARDSNTLIDMMVMQFVELDAIWLTVKDSTEEVVSASYREGIRENQLKLMVRIKKLAGPERGKRLIGNAIREARKSTAKKGPIGDSRPRATQDAQSSTTTVIPDLSAAKHTVDSRIQTITPPATPQRGEPTSDAEILRNAVSVMPDNRTLVHELLLNREYRIDIDDCESNRSLLSSALFTSMRADLVHGDSKPWILAMAENIQGKFQNLLKPGNSMHTLITEALDPSLISQELDAGQFSFEKFFAFMTGLLPRLCAPFRDAEVKVLVEEKLQQGDFVDRLEALMRFINLMQLDYANFLLHEAAPGLVKNAISYEQTRFDELLEQGQLGLDMTEKWWRASKAKVTAEAQRRDPEGINHPRSRITAEKIYAQMLVDVFTDLTPSPQLNEIPETLLLDKKRILKTRAEVLRIITTGAVLLQCKNLLKRDARSLWKTEAGRILKVLENSRTAENAKGGVQAALEGAHSMPAATRKHIGGVVGGITAAAFSLDILQSSSPSSESDDDAMRRPSTPNGSGSSSASASQQQIRDPVMRLLLTRLRGYLLARLSANSASEKVQQASGVSESLANLGLPEFVSAVGRMVDCMSRVGVADREAHGRWYESVAGRADTIPEE